VHNPEAVHFGPHAHDLAVRTHGLVLGPSAAPSLMLISARPATAVAWQTTTLLCQGSVGCWLSYPCRGGCAWRLHHRSRVWVLLSQAAAAAGAGAGAATHSCHKRNTARAM